MAISLGKDANRITVLGGTSSSDGITVVAPWTDPVTHRQLVDSLTSQSTGYSAVTSFTATNNTSGTAVQLASVAAKMVEIFVPTGNTSSQVAVGGSNVKAAAGSEVGTILISGVLQQFYVTNANLLWFDVGTNGDKISYNVYT